jgi:hypothetical protein
MQSVSCINDIHYYYNTHELLYINEGLLNILLSDQDAINSFVYNKPSIEEMIIRFKNIENKYTPRLDYIYNKLLDKNIEPNKNITISYNQFIDSITVFKNVKRNSLTKKISENQINRFISIINYIPDSFMYKEINIIKLNYECGFYYYLNDLKIDINIPFRFKLHNKFFVNNLSSLLSYFLTFTTMVRFESLIKSYAITKI